MTDIEKMIEQAARQFMEDEVQMTDHYDDYKESFVKGAKWAFEYVKNQECNNKQSQFLEAISRRNPDKAITEEVIRFHSKGEK
jgi:hypothetical protein